MHKNPSRGRHVAALGLLGVLGCAALPATPAHATTKTSFDLVRTKGLPQNCARNAKASVKLETLGFAEKLTIKVSGFPAGTPLVLFALQVPNQPFGIGWYLADLEVGPNGSVTKTIVSRLNFETFAVAPGQARAPNTHPGEDAANNPTFDSVHTYHLGLWFDSVEAGAAVGCPGGPTPFNGDHTAGVQVLNTGNFPNRAGPLAEIDGD